MESLKQLFALLAHEFGHKFSFRDEPCVSDNEAIGAFSDPGGGRQLIDALAWVLTQEAIERNEIGDDFGLLDVFRCGWTNDSSGDLANPRLEPGAKYVVRLKISERAGCRTTGNADSRRTELGILKVFDPAPDGSTRPAEQVTNEVFLRV